MALSLLRTGEEYGEVETCVVACQKVKALLFAQFSHRDGALGSSSTEGQISLTPCLLFSCNGTMPGLLLIVCRTYPTCLSVSNTSSFFQTVGPNDLSIFLQHTFQKFPDISSLFFEMSTFQQHTNISSKCDTFY
jgi:hypothetical protein